MTSYQHALESYRVATERVLARLNAQLPIPEPDVAAERDARAQLVLARDLARRVERLQRSARNRSG